MKIFILTVALILNSIPLFANVFLGEGRIHDAAFSPDGQTIVTASSIGLQTWDAETLTKEEFMRVPYGVRMIKWSPDGQYLFALRGNNQDHLMIKMPEFEILYEIPESLKLAEICYATSYYDRGPEVFVFEHSNFVNFSTDSSHIALITMGNNLVVLGSQNGAEQFKKTYQEDLTLVYFEDNDQSLTTNVEKIDIKSGERIQYGVGNNVSALSPDGNFVLDEVLEINPPIPILHETTGRVRTLVYNRRTESLILAEGSGRDAKQYYPNCWMYIPHRQRFFSNDHRFQFLLTTRSDLFNIIRYNKIEINGCFELVFQRTSSVEDPSFDDRLSTYFTQPFSSDGEKILVQTRTETDNQGINFGLISGVHVRNTNDMEQAQWFQDIHYPYANIAFLPQYEHKLYSMQLPYNVRPERAFTPPIIQIHEPLGSSDIINHVSDFVGNRVGQISAFATNSNLIVTDSGGGVQIRDAMTWELTYELPIVPIGFPRNLRFFNDDNYLLVAGVYEIALVDIKNSTITKTIKITESTTITDIGISPDNQKILVGYRDGQIYQWNYTTDELNLINEYEHSIAFIHYFDFNSTAIIILEDGSVIKIDLDTGQEQLQFTSPIKKYNEVYFLTPDNKYLIVGNAIWNLETNQQVGEFAQDMEALMEIDLSPDGEWLAATTRDGILGMWEFDDIISGNSEIRNFSNYEN